MIFRYWLALIGLSIAPVANAQDMESDSLAVRSCRAPSDGVIVLTSVPAGPSVAAGETFQIRPIWTTYPGHQDEVVRSCFRDWRLSADAPASLSADGSQILIAADAVVGDTFTLSARYAEQVVEEVFRVVERAASPLVGTWRPVPESCPEGTSIYGLSFASDGTFAVETVLYPHYNPTAQGQWRDEGQRLILSDFRASDAAGGTAPDFESEALFTLENGVLTFDRPWHGSVQGHGTCNAQLQRMR